MATEGERLAKLEEQIQGLRDDVSALTAETSRARDRLHRLEGTTAAALQRQKLQRENEREQYRRLGRAIQWAGLAFACAAVLVPLLNVLLTGR